MFVTDNFFKEPDSLIRAPPQKPQVSWNIVRITRQIDPEDDIDDDSQTPVGPSTKDKLSNIE